jgi:hypothetical protein
VTRALVRDESGGCKGMAVTPERDVGMAKILTYTTYM